MCEHFELNSSRISVKDLLLNVVLFSFLQVPLVVDKMDATKFAHILVNSKDLHRLQKRADSAKSTMPSVVLLNGAIDLVFTKEELGESGGMGKRKNDKPPLDSLKVEAVKGMSA